MGGKDINPGPLIEDLQQVCSRVRWKWIFRKWKMTQTFKVNKRTAPCNRKTTKDLDDGLAEFKEKIMETFEKGRAKFRQSPKYYTNIDPVMEFALRTLEKLQWVTVKMDKGTGIVIVPREECKNIVRDHFPNSGFYQKVEITQ